MRADHRGQRRSGPDAGVAYLASARGENYLPACGGYCNIMYSKETIHKRPHPAIKGEPNLYR